MNDETLKCQVPEGGPCPNDATCIASMMDPSEEFPICDDHYDWADSRGYDIHGIGAP